MKYHLISDRHKRIYHAMEDLYNDGKDIDFLSLNHVLDKSTDDLKYLIHEFERYFEE